jgi:hypothetical protein
VDDVGEVVRIDDLSKYLTSTSIIEIYLGRVKCRKVFSCRLYVIVGVHLGSQGNVW